MSQGLEVPEPTNQPIRLIGKISGSGLVSNATNQHTQFFHKTSIEESSDAIG